MDSEKSNLLKEDKTNKIWNFCENEVAIRCIPLRYLMGILAFLMITVVSGNQLNLGIAIMAMTPAKLPNGTLIQNSVQNGANEINWDTHTQELVLSSFMWLSWASPVPGGYLCRVTSGKSVIGVTTLLISILSAISPTTAKLSEILFIIVRVLVGFITGIMLTAVVHFLGNWSLNEEKTIMSSAFLGGVFTGDLLSSILSGLAIKYLNWESIFWVTGALGFFMTIIWFILAVDHPFGSKYISQDELKQFNENRKDLSDYKVVPWIKILTSLPVWSIFISHFIVVYKANTNSNDVPRYLHNILGYSVFDVGIVKTITCLLLLITNLPIAIVLDKIINVLKGTVKVRNITRKSVVCIGFLITASTLVFMTLTSSHPTVVIIFYVISKIAFNLAYLCYLSNILEIAQQYAGIISGFNNLISSLGGILSPLVTGLLLSDPKNEEQWNHVIYVISIMTILGAIFYGVFSSSEIQPWARKAGYDTREGK